MTSLLSRFIGAALGILIAGTTVRGAPLPVLLVDVNTAPVPSPRPRIFSDLVALNGALVFVVTDGAGRATLCRSDGAGTIALTGDPDLQSLHLLRAGPGTLLFIGFHPTRGTELWTSDGTTEGTVPLLTVDPQLAGLRFDESAFAPAGDFVFFMSGAALWRSDGTVTGTVRLFDFAPNDPPDDFAWRLTPSGSTLYFAAPGADGGVELWRSDGTAGGTGRVATAIPGPRPSFWYWRDLFELTPVGHMLFFAACERPPLSCALWVSDGTEPGTQRLVDFYPGDYGDEDEPFYPQLVNADGTLYFLAGSEPAGDGVTRTWWTSDGTPAGTGPASPPPPASIPAGRRDAATVDGTTYFQGYAPATGYEPWRSDASGETPLVDLTPGPASSEPSRFTGVSHAVFFVASAPGGTPTLWKTDGTAAGTVEVPVVPDYTPTKGAHPRDLVELNGTFLFSATDGATGRELWRSDGTAAGTVRVADLYPGRGGSAPAELTVFDGAVFFAASDPVHRRGLWRSDGTEAGTTLVVDATSTPAAADVTHVGRAGDTLFFTARDADGAPTLWRSDGTAAGTMALATVDAQHLMAVGATLYFTVYDDARGTWLWKSDGTSTGTVRVAPVFPNGGAASVDDAVVSGRTLFLITSRFGMPQKVLWRSNGTPAGTIRLGDLPAAPTRLARFDGSVFFARGSTLWRSDGTRASTTQVASMDAPISDLAAVGDTLFLQVASGLWRSDGTERGTTRVVDLPGPGRDLLATGAQLLLAAPGPAGPTALWSSDGTAPGTVPLAEIKPCGDRPLLIGGTVVLAAEEPAHGCELWTLPAAAPGLCDLARCTPPGCDLDVPACAGERIPRGIRRRLGIARATIAEACRARPVRAGALVRRALTVLALSAEQVRQSPRLSRWCAEALARTTASMKEQAEVWIQTAPLDSGRRQP